jgi:beta-lactamase class A
MLRKMKDFILKKHARVIVAVVFFVVGWMTGMAYDYLVGERSKNSIKLVRENPAEYAFINPLLYIDNSEVAFPEFDGLKTSIYNYIAEAQARGHINRASLYFRDLNTAKWTGVNEDDLYQPSSMLKVAVLMVYLKMAETNPTIVGEKYFYDEANNNEQHYIPANQFKNGLYRVDDLLGHMIIDSDNAATIPLSLRQEQSLRELYKKMHLPLPPEKSGDFMSARSFSVLFRSLYSSTYLIPSFSEQALALLSRTNFTKGLVAGVESGVTIAHKFGEHTIYYTNNARPDYQLHDCGVVYYPSKPYFICVMTEGKDFAELETVIRDISKKTFDYVKSQS